MSYLLSVSVNGHIWTNGMISGISTLTEAKSLAIKYCFDYGFIVHIWSSNEILYFRIKLPIHYV